MIKKIIVFIILFIFINPVIVRGDELLNISDFDLSDSKNVINTSEYKELNSDKIIDDLKSGNLFEVIGDIAKLIYDKTIGNVVIVEKTLINLLLIIIMSAFFTNFANVFSNNSISDTGFYICYLVCITIIISLFESFCVIAAGFIKLLLEFMAALIPAYFLSVAVIGQVAAAGFYQLTLVIISVCEFSFLKVVIPAVKIYLAISLVNNISQEDLLSKSSDVLKRFVKFVNKLLLAIVTGLNIIQGLILPSVDLTKNTAIRKMIGALPVVGDGSDAISGILLGSANLIKNTIGAFAIVIIVLICMVPFIKIQLYSVSVQILTALIQPVADKRIISSLTCMCESIKMLVRIIMTNALLFIISIAIICMTTNL